MTRVPFVSAALLSALLLVGCGGDDGQTRYRISGTVTLDGKAIPYGEVVFTPDSAKKNSGPQGRASIIDGKYDTSASEGYGTSGGAVIMRVNGMTGPGGKTLCEYEVPVELPTGSSTKDIDVPTQDAFNANPNATKGDAPEI